MAGALKLSLLLHLAISSSVIVMIATMFAQFVSFPLQSLNIGHRIIAGLQIIKALQKLYGAYLPIFTDNAESVNDFNLPDMDCQLIKLKVSDDKDLRIEVE